MVIQQLIHNNIRGQVLTTTDAQNYVITNRYTDDGFLAETIDAMGHTTRYTRDYAGRTLKIFDALNNFTENVYDTEGNLIERYDAKRNRTTYIYGPANELKIEGKE